MVTTIKSKPTRTTTTGTSKKEKSRKHEIAKRGIRISKSKHDRNRPQQKEEQQLSPSQTETQQEEKMWYVGWNEYADDYELQNNHPAIVEYAATGQGETEKVDKTGKNVCYDYWTMVATIRAPTLDAAWEVVEELWPLSPPHKERDIRFAKELSGKDEEQEKQQQQKEEETCCLVVSWDAYADTYPHPQNKNNPAIVEYHCTGQGRTWIDVAGKNVCHSYYTMVATIRVPIRTPTLGAVWEILDQEWPLSPPHKKRNLHFVHSSSDKSKQSPYQQLQKQLKQQQKKEEKTWWMSWNEYAEDYRPIHDDNPNVLGYWCTGEGGTWVAGQPGVSDSHSTLVAWIQAPTLDDAWAIVDREWPLADASQERQIRFANACEPGFVPGDRFPLK